MKTQNLPANAHVWFRPDILLERGDAEKQKDGLVNAILSAFSDPDKWPSTDKDRVDLLKDLYRKAARIRATQPTS